jgi:Na+/melibiose symporter-like transporter
MDGADRQFPRFAAAYGVGHFGKSLFWSCGEGLFVFYLTEICGVSPVHAGLVIGLALQISAIADLLLLKLCRRLLSRPAGVRRLQAAGAALTSLCFILFALTAHAPPDWRLAAALIGSLTFRAAYAMLDVPQNALMAIGPATTRQRTRLAAIRMVGSGLAGLAVSGLAYFLIAGTSALSIGLAAGAIGLVATGGAILTMMTAPRHDTSETEAPDAPWRALVSRRVSGLLAVGTAGAVASTLLSKLVPYFAAYGLRSPAAGGLLIAAVASGSVLTQLFWLRLGDRFSRRDAIEASCLTLMTASALFYPASSAGLWAILPCAAAQGAGIGGLGTAVWAAIGDEARSHRDPSAAAFLFALLTFLSKSALAGAAVLVTLALTMQPYQMQQPPEAWPLLPVMCLCPIALAALGLGAARFLAAPGPKNAL